jgi:hypothetical protein
MVCQPCETCSSALLIDNSIVYLVGILEDNLLDLSTYEYPIMAFCCWISLSVAASMYCVLIRGNCIDIINSSSTYYKLALCANICIHGFSLPRTTC